MEVLEKKWLTQVSLSITIDQSHGSPQCYARRAPKLDDLTPYPNCFAFSVSASLWKEYSPVGCPSHLAHSCCLVLRPNMSTPNARDRRSLRNSGVGTHTPSGEPILTGVSGAIQVTLWNALANCSCLKLQRLPSHTRYPLTPSRLVTTTPSAQRSASRFTPRARTSIAPSTPYGLRAHQQRAANTPGRDRRRSGRVQRETTFDILRNLGKGMPV